MDNNDLERQLAAYATQMDEAAADVEDLAPGDLTDVGSDAEVVSVRSRRRVPDWAFAGMAAAAVVILIGSVAVFSALRSSPDDPVATAPPTTTTTVVSEPEPSPAVLISDDPVIGSETVEDDDPLRFFTIGDIVPADGAFHGLFGIESKEPRLMHVSSQDGSVWEIDDADIEVLGVDDAAQMRATTLLQSEDGSWIGYFDVMRDLGGFGDHQYRYWVHRGTAPDITGPWTIDAVPALDAGREGAWDGGWVRNASVLPDGSGGWMMFYLGGSVVTDGAGAGQLGFATSADGVEWVRADEPVFVGDADSRFEDGALNRIQVKRIDGDLILTYAGKTSGNRGIAYSTDGQTWTRDDRNPVLTNLEVPRSSIYDTAMVYDDGTLRWYVGAGGFSSMAVYELRLDL